MTISAQLSDTKRLKFVIDLDNRWLRANDSYYPNKSWLGTYLLRQARLGTNIYLATNNR